MRAAALLSACAAFAADWPEWRGAGRGGVWIETGIVDQFPESGLKIRWRTPLKAGYSGPAVSRGRVFVLDKEKSGPNRATERAVALDEKTGRVLWTREWQASYTGLARSYSSGPRATPTVDGDRVYVLGAKGMLKCLDFADGREIWSHDFEPEYKTTVPGWGMVSAPLIAGNLVVAVAGGADNAKVVAFDKQTGKEIWRALDSNSEPGYAAPVLIEAGGRQQIIIWHASALVSLNPSNGEIYWQQPFNAHMGLAVATPVKSGPYLFTTSFYTGPMLMELAAASPSARMLWKGKSASEIETDGLHALINTPVIDGDHIYGICSYGQMRCLNLKTGARVWESLVATGEKARWATGFLVKNGSRYFLNNDRGDLIICRLTPSGYEEISRTKLIKPTSTAGIGRRELQAVNWSHPAYANGHIVARNDEEILSASLGK
ncbi:MAG: pyrrolo-quinoline quinone [Acidobacteria bacterium]|nr:pyrrolo-quinoline quinone [Acidobacteriota bacterium]